MDRLILWLFARGMIAWGFTGLAGIAAWVDIRRRHRDIVRLLRRNRDA
jgi:hypothetical protein